MSTSIDRHARIIRNLYSAVFEREPQRFNRIFRQVFQRRANNAYPIGQAGFISEVLRDYPFYYVRFDDSEVHAGDNTLARQLHYDLAQGTDFWNYSAAINPSRLVSGGLIPHYGGKAIQLHTANCSLQTINTQSGNWGDFAMECILSFDQNPVASATVDLIEVGPKLWIDNNRKLCMNAQAIGNKVATNALAPGQYHIVWSWCLGEGLSKLYVDGVLVESWASTDTFQQGSSTRAKIMSVAGTLWGGTFKMDEVAVYKHALPAHRVEAHYRAYKQYDTNFVPRHGVGLEKTPTGRFYSALTSGGSENSNDSSAWGFGSGITISYRGVGVRAGDNQNSNIYAVRLRPRWAYNAAPTDPTIFQLVRDANNYVRLFYDATAQQFKFRKFVSGSGTDATIASTHAAYTDLTIMAFERNGATIGISLNGGVFTEVANSGSFSLQTSDLFEIGNGANPSNCDIHWVLTGEYAQPPYNGTGSHTHQLHRDAQLLHALGNYDPEIKDVPIRIGLNFLWWARSVAHQPVGVVGGSINA